VFKFRIADLAVWNVHSRDLLRPERARAELDRFGCI
jgi:hypothetical protein